MATAPFAPTQVKWWVSLCESSTRIRTSVCHPFSLHSYYSTFWLFVKCFFNFFVKIFFSVGFEPTFTPNPITDQGLKVGRENRVERLSGLPECYPPWGISPLYIIIIVLSFYLSSTILIFFEDFLLKDDMAALVSLPLTRISSWPNLASRASWPPTPCLVEVFVKFLS